MLIGKGLEIRRKVTDEPNRPLIVDPSAFKPNPTDDLVQVRAFWPRCQVCDRAVDEQAIVDEGVGFDGVPYYDVRVICRKHGEEQVRRFPKVGDWVDQLCARALDTWFGPVEATDLLGNKLRQWRSPSKKAKRR